MTDSNPMTETEIQRRLSFVRTIGVVFIVGLLVFGFAIGGKTLVDARALLADHTEVTAQVVDKEIVLKRGGKGRTVRDHMVSYSFVGADGQAVVDRYETSKKAFAALSVGDPLPILYSNSEPSAYDRKELVERQASLAGLLRRLVLLTLFGGVWVALIYFLSKAKLRRQLAEQAPQQMPVANEAAG